MILQETHTKQNKHRKLLINDNDTEWLSDLIDCLQFFYKMTVKISGQNYCSFIIPCLKSLQVAMETLCENDEDNSEFKIQIASALKRSVNFYIDEFGFSKDSFLMASTFLDPRVRKFKKFKEKKAQNAKKFPFLSQVAKRILCVQGASTASERDFSASGYTVQDRRNALLPRKVNMMMVLQQFDKNIERLTN